MRPDKFRFKKIIFRNDFTKVFGSAGKRRIIPDYSVWPSKKPRQSKLARIRRANTGFKNKTYGKIFKHKMFMRFGMKKYPPISKFRR